MSARRATTIALALLALCLGPGRGARADLPTPPAAPSLAEGDLARALWLHSPELALARQAVAEADAGRGHAYLLPTPILSAGWATIPVGRRNPPGQPFWDVPNYSLQIAELVELGKRGPRQQAAEAAFAAARLDVADLYRQGFFALMGTLADEAEQDVRAAILRRLSVDGEESLRLQRARAERGDVAAIEVERLEVEHLRVSASVRQAEGAREAAVSACARILGLPCPRFASEDEARGFLEHAPVPAVKGDAASVAERADIQALAARSAQADAERVLAERRVLPDPVVGVGYQHDQFVVAGNQANSLNVAVTIPLPVFDRGQVDAARARRVRETAEAARRTLAAGAADAVTVGGRRIALVGEQARALSEEAIPRARDVALRMEAAARRGGAALPDVLLARRALEELQLDLVAASAERLRAILEVRRAAGLLPAPPAEP